MSSAKPDCYGLLWEDIPTSPCAKCHVKRDCLEVFSSDHMSALLTEHKPASLADIERITGVSVDALKLAFDYRMQVLGIEDRPPDVQVVELDPITEAASIEKGEALTTTIEVAEESYSPYPWKSEKWEAQHSRERQRSPLIGMVSPGVTLSRKYKGVLYEVEARDGYYMYQGRPYPTLYQIVMLITGAIEYPRPRIDGVRPEGKRKMSNWSAARFFSLGVKRDDQLRGNVQV